jgi:polyisoprenoid-binding protein YceI
MRQAVIWTAVVLLACEGATSAQPGAIDTHNSVLTVRVYRGGAFSAFGHDHEIAAPIARGSVDVKEHRVEVRVDAKALRVRDADVSEKDRAEIQKTMLGPQVLDAEQFPEIVFRSTSAEAAGPGAWKIHGNLTLHGASQPVDVDVLEKAGRYTGRAVLRQTGFGIKPVKVGGGAVRVKDEVRIEFDISMER